MEKYESVLSFQGYIVNEIVFKRNENFEEIEEGVQVNLNITPKIRTDNEKMQINLIVSVFEEAEKNNYPFEIKVDLTGDFIARGEEPTKFVGNAIAILYPYIRAIVSTYTANANVTALILPTINVNKLIEDQNKKD